jgi:hypothetical protein
MTLQERKIAEDFYFGRISKDDFLKIFPIDLAKDKKYIYNIIKDSADRKDPEGLDLALSLILFDWKIVFSEGIIELLSSLLKEHWHFSHENIVAMFQEIKSPTTIDVLYETAITKYNSVTYMETYSLARKCIHALGDINTDYAKEKLELLASSDIAIIKEKAEKQLHYYKR